ncbi:MAG: hypothetical protein WB368_13095, partial [Candidatus Sulfotelmatobacter sp.]
RLFHHQGTGRIRTVGGGGTVALGGTVTLSSNFSGTPDGIAYFSNPTRLTSTPAPTNGQILIGSLTPREILIRTISSVRPSTALRRKRKPKKPLRLVALRK